MDKEPPSENPISTPYKIGVYFFVAFYFFVAVVTLLPKSPLQSRLIVLVSPLSNAFSLSQNWKLFSPELREINFCSHAVIEFADGTTKLYEFPRLEEMNGFDAYRRQKLCKLFQDSMPWPDFAVFWPDVGRFIARANYDSSNSSNPPVQVSLAYNWIKVPQMENFEKQKDLKEPNRQVTFFVYRVRAEDLK